MKNCDTIAIENEHMVSFYKKKPIVIEQGEGVWVSDIYGKKYLDFTSGWAVTSLGHAHPVITEALVNQSKKIIHNPDSGYTYSPIRAKLLLELKKILPAASSKIFFANSGSEANDAAIKLARKITNRKKIISTKKSFHGRTIGTVSATGQSACRDRFNVLIPDFEFVQYANYDEIEASVDNNTAAVIVEPIQGEGGIRIPTTDYLKKISMICKKNGALLIVDEIQTGFFRTGPAFVCSQNEIQVDFLTMAKGIAGGFPFGAVAVSKEVAEKIEYGDHGGTYIGNPLGCAVAAAVIDFMVKSNISAHVAGISELTFDILHQWKSSCGELIADVRGAGLLIAIELKKESYASAVVESALKKGLILNLIHGKIIRLFPALIISEREMIEGLSILRSALGDALQTDVYLC